MILWVRNLPLTTTKQEMEDLFARFGSVQLVKVNSDRGDAHVEMASAEDAERALAALHRSELSGRMLFLQPVSDNASGLYFSPHLPQIIR